MQTSICWCNDCYCRRFPYGADDQRKFDDCEIQQALDAAFKENEKLRVQLEESQMWNAYKVNNNG